MLGLKDKTNKEGALYYNLTTIRYIPTDKLRIDRPIRRGLLVEA
jgi:hypothetical protein